MVLLAAKKVTASDKSRAGGLTMMMSSFVLPKELIYAMLETYS